MPSSFSPLQNSKTLNIDKFIFKLNMKSFTSKKDEMKETAENIEIELTENTETLEACQAAEEMFRELRSLLYDISNLMKRDEEKITKIMENFSILDDQHGIPDVGIPKMPKIDLFTAPLFGNK